VNAWSAIVQADRFVRLHFVFFTGVWPLLGAASVRRDGSLTELAVLLLAMACFHVYAYVLNDVIDLPIDRTQPSRAHDPLVRGAIRPGHALAIVFVQTLLTVPVTIALGGGVGAHVSLGIAFLFMTAYNLWGKRCPVPPLTDAVQGMAWGALAIYASYVLGPGPNALTWAVAAYATLFTLFINGIHGGLRDLSNDAACGAVTTAIYLGARPSRAGDDPIVPRAVGVFASIVLAAMAAILGALLWRNDFDYSQGVITTVAVVVGTMMLASAALMPKIARPRKTDWDVAFRLQMYLVLMAMPVLFAPYASAATLLLLAVLTAVSLLLIEWTATIVRWVWMQIRRAPAQARPAPQAGAMID
jgi:4-hydroxybenzoate polyprenyltransferase